jgi:hypothetical protein
MSRFPRRVREELPAPDYSNDAVVEAIVREAEVDRATAERWFRELLAFLDLAARSGQSLAPPKPIETAWLAFARERGEYEAYCGGRFGRVIEPPLR